MVNKFKIFIMSLIFMILMSTTYVFATTITKFDGPGPGYNGLIVGNTFWLKTNDVVDVLEGPHILQPFGNIPTQDWVGSSYLGLQDLSTGNVAEYQLNEVFDETPNTNQLYNKISGDPNIKMNGSRISVGADADNPLSSHFGFLYWMQFTSDNMTYKTFGNAQQSGVWYINNSDITQGKQGNNIETDSDAPTQTVDAPSSTTVASPLTVNINATDVTPTGGQGCGVQQLEYRTRLASDTGWEATTTVNPVVYSNPTVYDGTKFTQYDGVAMDSNTDIGGNAQHFPTNLASSTNSVSTSVTFTVPGTYYLEVESTDNLGNGNGNWDDYGPYIIGSPTVTTPPVVTPPVVTPKAPTALITAPATMEIGNSFGVAGTGTDPQNEKLTYTWTTTSGGTLSGTSGNLVMGTNPITVTLYVTDTDGLSSPTVSATINPIDTKPTVSLTLPATITLGDDLGVHAIANEPSGTALSYFWGYSSGTTGTISGAGGDVSFNDPSDVGKTKTFTVTVTNIYGETATASASTVVIAPQPSVNVVVSGSLKENRKVILSETSDGGSSKFVIDSSKTKWTFTDLSGNPVNAKNTADSSLVESLDSATGTSEMDMLFTKAGTYTATCTVYNVNGATATSTKSIVIAPDLPPVPAFNYVTSGLRDPQNSNLGTVTITDISNSIDGDSVDKCIYFYCFDTNNDGNDTDETWYENINGVWTTFGSYSAIVALANNPSGVDAVNSGNVVNITVTPNNFNGATHVGRYFFKEIIREQYGQDTIPSLVTVNDRKIAIN